MKKGDKVKLIKKEKSWPKRSNPKLGAIGVIEKIGDTSNPAALTINVKWNNGMRNAYGKAHLQLVESKEYEFSPEIDEILKSIGGTHGV